MPIGGSATGFFALSIKAIVGMFALMYWMLFAGYWILRAVYWELPRAGYRSWQRRQAASPTGP
ncbi:hypothetical protein [Streptomyces sp. OK228]|uniref:hypothetical protein n=1 Tax=Streptomyces sp. OK228 TaxID=1882786 RepID=UPI001C543665|nr:hypothetical protein [Streptomyces sp. OK228]